MFVDYDGIGYIGYVGNDLMRYPTELENIRFQLKIIIPIFSDTNLNGVIDPKFNFITDNELYLQSKEIRKYHNDIRDENLYRTSHRQCILLWPKYNKILQLIEDEISGRKNPYFIISSPTLLSIDQNEDISTTNGLHILTKVNNDIFSYDLFLEILYSMNNDNNDNNGHMISWTFKEWEKVSTTSYCYRCRHNNILSKDDIIKMWNLPYHCETLLKIMRMSCALGIRHDEIVRFANHLCIWVLRKQKFMIELKNKLENEIIPNSMPTIITDLHNLILSYVRSNEDINIWTQIPSQINWTN